MITTKELAKAKDLMTKGVIAISRHTPVLDAAKILIENHITGLPVVNHDMELIGILSEKDILRLYYDPSCGTDKSVEDFMTEKVLSFDENISMAEICDCLINNSFRRVLITANGKLVGIITRRDLIRYIIELSEKN